MTIAPIYLADTGRWFSNIDSKWGWRSPGPFPLMFGWECETCCGSGEDWDGRELFCPNCLGTGQTPLSWYRQWFSEVPKELKEDALEALASSGVTL